jgi:N-acetylglucosaminyl-diphospho-decaprenol L-rhamnosyltransferase
MSPGRSPALTAVVVTHDSAHVLSSWIDAFEALDGGDRLELCVVDSGSSERQRARMREQAAGRVDAFLSLPNVGYGAACNAGAEASRGTTLLFTNPDVEIVSLPAGVLDGKGLASGLLGAFATEPDRPLGFEKLPTWGQEAQDLALGRWSQAYRRSASHPAWVSGAALLIDRGDFERIGGFSPAFFMYFEDADLCARHRYAGGRVELSPELVVRHASGDSTEDAEPLRGALEGVNRLSGRRFAARYGAAWQRLALYSLLAFLYLPRRILADIVHGDASGRDRFEYAACLLFPRFALGRLS